MLFSHKNDVESFADNACRCVKIWLHPYTGLLLLNPDSPSQNQWSLLL